MALLRPFAWSQENAQLKNQSELYWSERHAAPIAITDMPPTHAYYAALKVAADLGNAPLVRALMARAAGPIREPKIESTITLLHVFDALAAVDKENDRRTTANEAPLHPITRAHIAFESLLASQETL